MEVAFFFFTSNPPLRSAMGDKKANLLIKPACPAVALHHQGTLWIQSHPDQNNGSERLTQNPQQNLPLAKLWLMASLLCDCKDSWALTELHTTVGGSSLTSFFEMIETMKQSTHTNKSKKKKKKERKLLKSIWEFKCCWTQQIDSDGFMTGNRSIRQLVLLKQVKTRCQTYCHFPLAAFMPPL